jgi:hypothetical protein
MLPLTYILLGLRQGKAMSTRRAARLGWGSWALSLAMTAGALYLVALNRAHPDRPVFSYWAENTVGALTYATLGAIIVARRRENVMGWLFCANGLSSALLHLCAEYAVHALAVVPRTLPGGDWAAWLAWMQLIVGTTILGTFQLLYFPDGRLPSPRWRVVAWLAAIDLVVGGGAFTLVPGALPAPFSFADNPAGIAAAAGVLGLVATVGNRLLVPLVLCSFASLVIRFRRACGDERQALKWFAYAAAVALFAFFVLPPTFERLLGDGPLSNALDSVFVTLTAQVGMPLAITIAILRHRLYDIDLLVNRTLVYGTLTAALAATYFGGVALLQGLFRAATGQGSNAAVVASTLAVAALFQPLRRRFQDAIDRRFYRRRYDAQRTLAAFGARLRDETDLERLGADLLTTVEETVQPAHVSLWLRPTDPRR